MGYEIVDLVPTQEQNDFRDAVRTGEDVKLTALAGTGKTSSALMAAKDHLNHRILYAAFNRSIADEAASKFPSNTLCKTMHSLAFAAMGKRFQHRLNGPRVPSWKVQDILRIPERFESSHAPGLSLRGQQMARLVTDGVIRFCHSADMEPAPYHLPNVPGFDDLLSRVELQQFLFPYVQRAWGDLSATNGKLKYAHDVYLKTWAMGDPKLFADIIIFDEAQDANPLIHQIILSQDAQVLAIGDPQQQIYCQPLGTKVKVSTKVGRTFDVSDVSIEDLKVGDFVTSYDIANATLMKRGDRVTSITRQRFEGELLSVKTDSGNVSAYTPDHHVIVRVNDALDDKHVLYMMRRNNQYRIGIAPWKYSGVNKSLVGPVFRANSEGGDAFWVLEAFASKRESSLAEALASYKFNIPTWCFNEHRKDKDAGVCYSTFWEAVGDNSSRAQSCLDSYGRSIDAPLWTKSGDGGIFMLRRPLVMHASNLMDGMRVLSYDSLGRDEHHRRNIGTSKYWEPVTVTRIPYSDDVISISVENRHTYFADGVLTHNSWRGAINSMDKMDFPHELPLRHSFRFGPEIADEVNRILSFLPTDLQVVGFDKVESHLARLDAPTAVLTRTNAQAVARLMLAQMAGIRAGLVGGTYAVENLAQAALDLRSGKKTFHPDLLAFDNWTQVQNYVRDDPDATDLLILVKLVDTYGAERLLAAVGQAVPEQDAEMVISTGHRSKGREWDRVLIDQDFPEPFDEETGLPRYDEMRVAYVVASRAQKYLDSHHLSWLDSNNDSSRDFVPSADVPPRPIPVTTASPSADEQVVCDPLDATKLMFRRTPYSVDLINALKSLPRRAYRTDYHGESKANLCLATRGALDVAERFGLTVSKEARNRVQELSGE